MENKKILENVKLKIALSNFSEEEKQLKTNSNILKLVAGLCIVMLSITGMTKATEIRMTMQEMFGNVQKEGMKVAMENGCITFPEVEYKQELNGIQVGISSFLLDKYTFSFTVDVVLPDEFMENAMYLDFNNIKVLDENNKKILEKRLGNTDDITGRGVCKKGGWWRAPEQIGANKIRIYYEATGVFDETAKIIKISLGDLYKTEYNGAETREEHYHGIYDFIFQVPEEANKFHSKVCKVKNTNDETIKVNTAILSKTEFYIEYETQRKIVYGGEYITTKDGRKFEKSDGDAGVAFFPDEGKDEEPYYREASYGITIFDITDEFTFHIPTQDGEEILVEFEIQ